MAKTATLRRPWPWPWPWMTLKLIYRWVCLIEPYPVIYGWLCSAIYRKKSFFESTSKFYKIKTKAKLGKRAPTSFSHWSILYKTAITFGLPPLIREEIRFKNGQNHTFEGPVTLTLTLDDLECYIVEFVSSNPIHWYIACSSAEHSEKTQFSSQLQNSIKSKRKWNREKGLRRVLAIGPYYPQQQ